MNWNKYPESKPSKSGRYLVYRAKCNKWHPEKWNGLGWAYNYNDITHWIEVETPDYCKHCKKSPCERKNTNWDKDLE